jgi:outer membrane protein assembly factor BamA
VQVYENAQVLPEHKKEGVVDLTIQLKEKPPRMFDSEMEWPVNFAMLGKAPLPYPAVPAPGGMLKYEDRNLFKKGDQLTGDVHCASFLHPSDDLQLRAQFKRPAVFERNASRKERSMGTVAPSGPGVVGKPALVVDAFNSRRLSSVFTGVGAAAQAVPTVWVERAGAQLYLEQQLSQLSKAYAGFVTQQVKTRDDTNALVTHGQRVDQRGQPIEGGPPTTLSGTGCDRSIHAQAGLKRDTTTLRNGMLIGARDLLEVNQGLGLGNGVFNRYLLSTARFLPLWQPPPVGKNKAPYSPVALVLHAQHGSCIGPHPSYEWRTLGGPFSSRAYSIGELGAARTWLEALAELRVPVPFTRAHAFAFVENARDLGEARDLPGKPREYYNKAGSGTSMGGGLKLSAMRFEWALDCNRGKGTWLLNFGERC